MTRVYVQITLQPDAIAKAGYRRQLTDIGRSPGADMRGLRTGAKTNKEDE